MEIELLMTQSVYKQGGDKGYLGPTSITQGRGFSTFPPATPLLFCLIVLSMVIFFRGWPDSDGIATLNHICGKEKITVLPLAQEIFSSLPCDGELIKFIQIGLILAILFIISHYFPLSFLGYASFFSVFLLTFEDDLLATPFILLLSWWALSKPRSLTLPIKIAGAGILLSVFLWAGSFVPLGLLTAYLIWPPLSFFFALIGVFINGFNSWGNSGEVLLGNGYVIGAIGLFLVIGCSILWKRSIGSLKWLLYSFAIVVFFIPKFGEWIVIPLFPALSHIIGQFTEFNQKAFHFIGYWLFFLSVAFTLLTIQPTNEQWKIILEAKSLQDKNHVVLNDWGVGHEFAFIGGKPSQSGGYLGPQDHNGPFYWLGGERTECETVSFADRLFLQKCRGLNIP